MATETSNIKGYKVLVDEVTVHRELNAFPQEDGSVIRQNGRGQTFYKDEVIQPEDVSGDYKEILADDKNPAYKALRKKLRPVRDEPAEDTALRLGIPFAGYDEMDEDDILSAMEHLPSETIQRIKEYEGGKEGPRARITDYNIGFGENSIDRQNGNVGSPVDEPDEDKRVGEIQTREVPESGAVIPGEGITGTGDPVVAPGTASKGIAAAASSKRSTAGRSGRRSRSTAKPKPAAGKGDNKDDKSDSDKS